MFVAPSIMHLGKNYTGQFMLQFFFYKVHHLDLAFERNSILPLQIWIGNFFNTAVISVHTGCFVSIVPPSYQKQSNTSWTCVAWVAYPIHCRGCAIGINFIFKKFEIEIFATCLDMQKKNCFVKIFPHFSEKNFPQKQKFQRKALFIDIFS